MAASRDIELALRIRADVEQALREIRELRGGIARTGRTGERASRDMDRLARSGQRTASVFGQLRGVLATIGIGLLVREVIRADDAYAQIEGRLRLVTDSAEELAQVEQELFDVAQRTRGAFTGTVDLYTRLARSTKSLNVSQGDLISLTETINQAMIVSGASSEAAANATFQLSQAFQGGTLRAEEYNSIIDQAPRLIEALAAGTGIAMEDFREAVNSGRITAELMFNALRSQADVVAGEFGQMERTVGQAMTQLTNDLQRASAAGDLNPLVDAIDRVREIVGDPQFIENVGSVITGLAGLTEKVVSVAAALGHLPEVFGADVENAFVRVDDQIRAIDRHIGGIEVNLGRRAPGPDAAMPFDLFFASEEEMLERLAELNAERKRLLDERARLEQQRFRELFPEQAGGAGGGDGQPAPPPAAAGGDDEEDEAATKARESLAKLNEQLRQQVETFGAADSEVLRYRLTLGDLADDVAKLGPEGEKLAASIVDQASALERLDAQKEVDAAAEERRNKLLEEGRELTERLRTAQEVYNAEVQRYGFLLQQGKISQETFNRAVAAARERLDEAGKDAAETGDQMSQFAIQASRNMQSAFADFLFNPFEQGLQGMASSFAQTIHRMVSELLASQLLQFIGTSIGGPVGGFISAAVAHEGGEVGDPTMPRRSVSPLLFLGAPRLHNGLAPDEFPAILQRGESVLTRDQTDALEQQGGGGGPSSVRVILTDDRSSIGDYLATSDGEQAIVQVVRRNAFALKQVLGG